MSTPTRPWHCSACRFQADWRDMFERVFLAGLNSTAAIPITASIWTLVAAVMLGRDNAVKIMEKLVDAPVYGTGGWLCFFCSCAAFIFCWKIAFAAKDREIAELKRAPSALAGEQLVLNLQSNPTRR